MSTPLRTSPALSITSLAAALGLALLASGTPRPAQACGGTFCDNGPAAMPVDQTGETILFVVDQGHVEAHIQIEIDPDTGAEQFAWIVPVTALPEFSVGSQQLIANLLAGTVPAYGMGTWGEPCGFDDDGGWDGCDGTGGAAGDDGGGVKLDIGGGEPEGPTVVLATTVGAFEVFVLDGGTVAGVMTWLGDNGFQQDPAAEPILAEYLAEGHMFAAFRLAAEADVAEVHPITLRFEGDEPCVPIRLTRIAAQDDMEIRALFLSDDRVASSNYRHVTLNPLKIDWQNGGTNYREVVSRAIDEPGADGHAFVTEYAGSSDVVGRDGLVGPQWNAAAFEATTPAEAVELLLEQGLWGFDPQQGECAGLHALVEGLVGRYLVTPEGITPELICADPAGFAAEVDPLQWDAEAFALAVQQRIVEPGVHAEQLLDSWPVLTRLYTTISPHEMTFDPMFHATPELPEVGAFARLLTRNQFCDGNVSYSLPDGRLVAPNESVLFPDIAPKQMPWVETVEYLPAAGAPMVEVDHRDLIGTLLSEWNEQNGPPRSPTSVACGEDSTGGSLSGGSGSPGSSGGSVGADEPGLGCACRSVAGSSGGAGWWSACVLGLGLRRRRYRRARGH